MKLVYNQQNHNLTSFLIIALGIATSIIVGILTSGSPLIIAILMVLGTVAVFSIVYPNVATQAFIFLLYTNTPVILNKFHGVPFIVTAVFPLLLMVPFVFLVIFRREKIIFTHVFWMILGLLLVQTLGTLFSINISTAFEHLFTFIIEATIIYFFVTNVIRSEESMRHIMIVMFIATIFLAIFPIMQFITGTTDNQYGGFARIQEEPGFTTSESLLGSTRQLRYSGALGEKNRFAQTMFMLMMLPLPYVWRASTRNWRLLAIATVGLSAMAGILAFSRGAAVGLVITFLIAVFLRLLSSRQILLILLGVSMMLVAVPQYAIRLMSLTTLGHLFGFESSSTDGPDGALEGRMTEMYAAFIVYSDHPIIGVGPEMFRYYSQDIGNQLGIHRLSGNRRAHSLYFDILSNTGTLGLILYGAIIFTLIRQLLQVYQRWKNEDIFLSNTALGFLLAIVTYMTTGIFLHFAYIRYFWTTLALASAIIMIANNLAEARRQATELESAMDRNNSQK